MTQVFTLPGRWKIWRILKDVDIAADEQGHVLSLKVHSSVSNIPVIRMGIGGRLVVLVGEGHGRGRSEVWERNYCGAGRGQERGRRDLNHKDLNLYTPCSMASLTPLYSIFDQP